MSPLTPGYLSPTLHLGHVDFGGRYMINEYLGFKGNLEIGTFREARGVSAPFTTNYLALKVEGIGNFGRILNFDSFSKRLGFLGHLGAVGGRVAYQEPALYTSNEADYNYMITSGFTTLFIISDQISLFGDISINVNGRQTYTLDGNAYNTINQPNPPTNPFVHASGTWWTGTLGLNFYLGKSEKHADWYVEEEKYAPKQELNEAVRSMEDMLEDSDSDGIPDYLDKELSTPVDARVDTFGITVDSDRDGIPDHLDDCPFLPGPSSSKGCPTTVEAISEVDYLRKAINDSFLNLYFAFDSDRPLAYSVSAAQYVSNFLKRNPGENLEIKGYADELGPEDYNILLSERRAKAVYYLLIDSGNDASRLSFNGYVEET